MRKEITLALQNGHVWSILTETLPMGTGAPSTPDNRGDCLAADPADPSRSEWGPKRQRSGVTCVTFFWVVTNAGTQESLGALELPPYSLTGHGGEPSEAPILSSQPPSMLSSEERAEAPVDPSATQECQGKVTCSRVRPLQPQNDLSREGSLLSYQCPLAGPRLGFDWASVFCLALGHPFTNSLGGLEMGLSHRDSPIHHQKSN